MKKFKELLIAGIDEDIEGTTIERLMQVKKIFESEMLWEKNALSEPLIQKRLQDWLQGLCSAVYVPYMNHEIIEWHEKELNRKVKEHERDYNHLSTEATRWVERYWPQCARTLYDLLYR